MRVFICVSAPQEKVVINGTKDGMKKGQVNDALKELDYIEENVFKYYIVRSLEVVEKISYPIA